MADTPGESPPAPAPSTHRPPIGREPGIASGRLSPSHPRRPDATHSSRRERTGRRPGAGALRARTLSVLLVAIGVAMITGESFVRAAEARTGADLARMVGLVPARAVGSAVVFPLEGRFVGYAVTEGCTVAFLVAPFFVLAALLIASRRTRPLRGLRALAAVSLVFFTVNQARLLVVAASMRVWGISDRLRAQPCFPRHDAQHRRGPGRGPALCLARRRTRKAEGRAPANPAGIHHSQAFGPHTRQVSKWGIRATLFVAPASCLSTSGRREQQAGEPGHMGPRPVFRRVLPQFPPAPRPGPAL